MDLALVLLILIVDLLEFLVPVFLNLSDGLFIAIDQLLVVFLLLVDLSLLILHFLLVLLLFE